MRIKLVSNRTLSQHVSSDTVREFERAVVSDGLSEVVVSTAPKPLTRLSYLTWKALEKSIGGTSLPKRSESPGTHKESVTYLFSILMGVKWDLCFPQFLKSGRKGLYLFDSWPDHHGNILNFAGSINPEHIFISSSESAKLLQLKTRYTQFIWIPEGVDPHLYRSKPAAERRIEVLALGRKYNAHHEKIVDILKKKGVTYLYEKTKGKIIFPTRDEFIEGLSESKISVCVPSSITHPERAGNIETLTIRYLQSMASKCLVLGHAPQEMKDLFGYNPVIEIDMSDPSGQILDLTANYHQYSELIQKNYDEVVSKHTWAKRWEQIRGIIS